MTLLPRHDEQSKIDPFTRGPPMYYNVPVTISKQEDGLWRVEAPALQGCFVDAATLEQALSEIHECIAMWLDLEVEEGRPLPEGIAAGNLLPIQVTIPVAPTEHIIKRYRAKGPKRAASNAKSGISR